MTSDWPPSLTLETEPVLRLFTGENFYSSADAAIREAVLNSIDAIGRQIDKEPETKQQIEITFDRENQTIEITDNGEGMDQNDLANLFSKVGASASRITQGQQHYRAVGEFGIGALSYFLICRKYHIQTLKNGSPPVGLMFSEAMLDGNTHAEEIEPTKTSVGTTIKMFVKSPELFQMTIDKFPHWMRNVSGLSACIEPSSEDLKQGGLTRQVRTIATPPTPDWIEESDIGPPENLDIWDKYDGKGQVDILYRGVFVERVELEQLWGLEGAIHVDPKHFRPKLNREGFVGDSLKSEVTPFMRAAHPLVLQKAIECIHELLLARDDWSLNKAITLWLAVPRSPEYKDAARVWDNEFRNRKAFRLLGQSSESEVSIAELKELNTKKIYLAPDQIDQSDPVIGQAIRVLRAEQAIVVQGLQRDTSYLSTVSMSSNYTSWLLLNTFRDDLPEIINVHSIAKDIVGHESLADIFNTVPEVKLVELGPASSPFIAIGNEIWINIETEEGRKIVEETCQRNEGHLGLWVACMMHAPEQGQRLDQVGALLRRMKPAIQRLGLVRRQFLRTFLQ